MRPAIIHQACTTGVKNTASSRLQIVSGVLIVACLLASGCAAPASKTEEAPLPAQTVVTTQPQPMVALPQPKPNEVQQVVTRVFKDAALVDADRNPNFVVGDFNGDLSQDIAIVLKPAPARLSELNEDLSPWILRDPFVTQKPGMARLRIAANDSLLAVIHGFGPEGWRDSQATQTYLLKNAVGSRVETKAKTDFMAANQGKNVPRLSGDLIAEVLRGASGFLYYDEAAYSWYDPKTFKGEPERKLVHQGMARRKQ